MMIVTGYKLRELLRNQRTLRDVHANRFNETLWQFDNKSERPQAAAESFRAADHAVAMLEEAQQYYNLQVRIKVAGETLTLSRAIKLIGGAGRLEKMWRSAAKDTGRDRYSYREMTRKADDIVAQRMISIEESIKLATIAAQYASELRAAIAEANTTKVNIEISSDLIS
jgi:hypothetical protein